MLPELPRMRCPNCAEAFPRYSSLRLSPFTIILCKHCGAQLKRVNKLLPLALALGGLAAFYWVQTTYPLSGIEKAAILGAIVWVALVLDEATAKLAVVD